MILLVVSWAFSRFMSAVRCEWQTRWIQAVFHSLNCVRTFCPKTFRPVAH